MREYSARAIETLTPYESNARTHTAAQVKQIAESIREFGWTNPVLIDEQNRVIAGHGRIEAAKSLGLSDVPCIVIDGLTDAQRRALVIADNQLAINAGWDTDTLTAEIAALRDDGFALDLLGFDEAYLDELLEATAGAGSGEESSAGSLAAKYLVPPFSVLNARDGKWQERKTAWIARGISSGDGRAELLTYAKSSQPPPVYEAKNRYEKKIGRTVTMDEFLVANPDVKHQSSTSIFDPVLCEILYSWFSPPGGMVLDPFSGGSVRGIVAAMIGRDYVGIDIRPEQVEANRSQWDSLNHTGGGVPVWITGDSVRIDALAQGVAADFLFSCPPYGDLEVYSDDPADISTMDYGAFLTAYREIIRKGAALLKPDRFACFVVGEFRDKKGGYRNFVADTIKAFTDAGLTYYNEIILVTQASSLAIRTPRTFKATRKVGKSHQNVLVFVKGDARKATHACGDVEIDETMSDAVGSE
jgi:DNA modification methylase